MSISSLNTQTLAYTGLVGGNSNMSAGGQGRQFMQPLAADAGQKTSGSGASNVIPITGSLTPQLSAAVNRVLLSIQETGSAFSGDEQKQVTARGTSQQDQKRYAEIIHKAATSGGYEKPVEFIQSLPAEDKAVLQRIHGLAEPSGVTNTNEEGALNMLLNRKDAVDINNDGITNVGAARLFSFPPPNSPQSVKDAWAEITKDLPPEERLMSVAPFMVQTVMANIKADSQGRPIGMYEPGEEGYTNVFGTSEEQWEQLIDRMLNMLDAARDNMDSDKYTYQRSMLSDFKDGFA